MSGSLQSMLILVVVLCFGCVGESRLGVGVWVWDTGVKVRDLGHGG